MKKRILALCFLSVFTLSAYSCENKKTESSKEENSQPETSQQDIDMTTESAASSVTPTEPEAVEIIDYDKEYSRILDTFYEYMANPDEHEDMEDDMIGVAEIRIDKEPNEVLSTVGYSIEDITGDEIPELVIGYINDTSTNEGYIIYNIYTYSSEPILVENGWARKRISLMDNGDVYIEGSNGAMYSVFGTYSFDDNSFLRCKDYYFTYETDESMEEIGFYYNNVGTDDKTISTQLDITNDEFFAISEELLEHRKNIEFTPFSTYTPVTTGAFTAKVTGEWVYDASKIPEDAVEFDFEGTDANQQIMFKTNKEITDVKILKLVLVENNEESSITFDTEELFSTEKLTPESALIVKNVVFEGRSYEYAISYTDIDGDEKIQSFSLSGMDGSIVLDDDVNEMINKN